MSEAFSRFRAFLRHLYFGSSNESQIWRYSLLIFDILTLAYFIIGPFVHQDNSHNAFDYALAVILTLDYFARLLAAAHPGRYVLSFASAADLIVIVSLIVPAFFDNLAFLRVVRMLRLMRSYHLLRELREASSWFRRNEDILQSSINLFVFIFVVTAIVFVLEVDRNDGINNYLDALYFTVTTLTTTGSGDITMTDNLGRWMTVIIMIFGVALFLRLVQTIFRPAKAFYPCPKCGLKRHDPDAVYCKHCGNVVTIPTDGDWS